MERDASAAELGLTLVELIIVMTIIAVLLALPISSYLRYRTQAESVNARANVHAIVNSIEAYHVDHESYVGMTLDALRASYDQSLDPARYTLTGVTATSYCVSSRVGEAEWRRNGPGSPVEKGGCA